MVGVAPGTKLYSVKVLGATGSGTLSQILCGINWVTANAATLNIKVANISFAGVGKNDNNCGNTNRDAEHQAICNATKAGVTFVAAAGNNGANLANDIPAAYPEVLTTTAMTRHRRDPWRDRPGPVHLRRDGRQLTRHIRTTALAPPTRPTRSRRPARASPRTTWVAASAPTTAPVRPRRT